MKQFLLLWSVHFGGAFSPPIPTYNCRTNFWIFFCSFLFCSQHFPSIALSSLHGANPYGVDIREVRAEGNSAMGKETRDFLVVVFFFFFCCCLHRQSTVHTVLYPNYREVVGPGGGFFLVQQFFLFFFLQKNMGKTPFFFLQKRDSLLGVEQKRRNTKQYINIQFLFWVGGTGGAGCGIGRRFFALHGIAAIECFKKTVNLLTSGADFLDFLIFFLSFFFPFFFTGY